MRANWSILRRRRCWRPRRHELGTPHRIHLLRSRDFRRHRGHLEGSNHPAYAANVRDQRNPRHHLDWRDPDCGQCHESARDHPGIRGRPAGDPQRGGRFCRDRPHARDVQRPAGARQTRKEVNLWISLAYLLAAVLFILGLKQLSGPRGARRGNQTAAVGMVIAVLATIPLLHFTVAGIVVTLLGLAIGAPVGAISARRVHMTAMPQMVAAFNGVGGGAAALVSISELLHQGLHPTFQIAFPSIFSMVVGGISFAGSAIAFAKLQGLITGTPITYAGQQVVNALIAIAIVGLAIANLVVASQPIFFVPLLLLALLLGVAFVLPIGGADMPVVISLLNAFTGLSVAATGFVLNNFALIVAGALVGASRSLPLTLMSPALGRSLAHQLFGAFGQIQAGAAGAAGAAATAEGKTVRAGSPEDLGTMLAYARKVI